MQAPHERDTYVYENKREVKHDNVQKTLSNTTTSP